MRRSGRCRGERYLRLKNQMAFDSVNKALELKVSPTVKLVLAKHENSETRKYNPSYGLLERETGLHRSTVVGALKEARKAGLISWASCRTNHESNDCTLLFARARQAGQSPGKDNQKSCQTRLVGQGS